MPDIDGEKFIWADGQEKLLLNIVQNAVKGATEIKSTEFLARKNKVVAI